MVDRIVTSIIEYQLKLGTISEDDVNVYRYGYTVFIEQTINILLSIFISILLGKFTECILLLITLIPLRSFCGGYHAKRSWQCVLLSNASILLILVFSEALLHYHIPLLLCMLTDIVLAIIIIYFSPVESDRKKLSISEKRRYKQYAGIIISIEVVLGIVFFVMGYPEMLHIIVGVHILQMVSLLLGNIKCEYS